DFVTVGTVEVPTATRTGFWLFLFRCQGATTEHTSSRKEVPPRCVRLPSRGGGARHLPDAGAEAYLEVTQIGATPF
ncbi:MAG: hypothetical protein ACLP1E_10155, partial [Acidimicrobiales bacterium]